MAPRNSGGADTQYWPLNLLDAGAITRRRIMPRPMGRSHKRTQRGFLQGCTSLSRRASRFGRRASLVAYRMPDAIVFDGRLVVRSWRITGSMRQVVANAVAVVALVADELGGIYLMQLHPRVITFNLVRLAARHIGRSVGSFNCPRRRMLP